MDCQQKPKTQSLFDYCFLEHFFVLRKLKFFMWDLNPLRVNVSVAPHYDTSPSLTGQPLYSQPFPRYDLRVITNMAVFQQCFKFYEHIKPIISTPKIIISCMELINQACLFFFSHKLSMAMGHLIGGTHRIWPISLSNRYFLLLLSKLIQNKTRLSNRFFFPSFSSKNSLRTQSNTPLVS